MNFDSYIINGTELSLTVPITYTSTRKAIQKHKGFTLAEVLITLTIIGVIAAMTVPTLMSNVQKQTYATGLKKAYSTLTNAMKMLPLSRGCSAGDYSCALYTDNGNVTEIDGKGFEGTDIGAKALYLLSTQIKHQKLCFNENCLGDKYPHNRLALYPTASLFVADNGIIYGMHFGENYYIGVDVNGTKGPNKIGMDIFHFLITTEEKPGIPIGSVIPDGSALHDEYSESVHHYKFDWKTTDSCTSAKIAKGLHSTSIWTDERVHCTARVLEEGAIKY